MNLFFAGKSGNPQIVLSNYFELTNRPDMHLLQYRVDFLPEVDHIGVRKALLRQHQTALGKYLFDGTLLYGIVRLPQVSRYKDLKKFIIGSSNNFFI